MNGFLSRLPDYDHCLVNLAGSILKKFGAETTVKTLPLADRFLSGEYQNIVILLLDAMGTPILEKHLDQNGFFRSHLAGSFDSVYPPTTVAATTSVLSGKYPNEHGWLGWDVYYPQLGKNVTLFTNREQIREKADAVPDGQTPDGRKKWTEQSLEPIRAAADFNAAFQYMPYQNILDRIREAGGTAWPVTPFMPPYPQTLDAILERISELCKEHGNKFIYAYWNEPDQTMHRTGTNSSDTHAVLTELEKKTAETISGLSDTLFLITADHGHMDSRNCCILDYPEITDCLVRLPSIEPRTLNLFVRERCRKSFPGIFRRYFGDAFLLLTREEVMRKKVFGPGKDRDGLTEMIGDYVALAVSDISIFNTHIEAQEMPGGHAGLTREEITIPLIAVERK